jgi:DNA polymerase-3 subunit beta
MELTIQKQNLLDGLQMVQGIVEKKSSMPNLSHVLIETIENGIQITATDLQVGIRLKSPAKIDKPGGISLLARKLFEIVRELPEEEVYLKLNENNRLFISCKGTEYNLMGLPASDFPPLPEVDLKQVLSLDGELLKEMIHKTIISISLDEGRYNLSGIYFEYQESEGKSLLRMVSTDGHRLTMMDKEINPLEEGIFSKGVLLPRKSVVELLKILESPGQVKVGFKDNQGVFVKDDILMVIRLLEKKFPDYHLVLPKKKDKVLSLSKNNFLETMKRMAVLSSDRYRGVKFLLSKGKLEIQSVNPDLGDAREDIPLEYKGNKLEAGFNARFFIDAILVMESETLTLELSDSVSPAVLRGEKDPGFLALIMPMKLMEETE